MFVTLTENSSAITSDTKISQKYPHHQKEHTSMHKDGTKTILIILPDDGEAS